MMAATETAQLALDTILQKPTKGIPTGFAVHAMDYSHIERIAGAQPGDYKKEPVSIYLAVQRAAGACVLDQWIPDNPLTMGQVGYDPTAGVPPPSDHYIPYNPVIKEDTDTQGVTTGSEEIIINGIRIDSPEAVVDHLERFVFPQMQRDIARFDEESRVREIIDEEASVQEVIGPDILKTGFNFVYFPYLYYGLYGYEYYFMAYALYPDVIERHFSLQADYALLNNRAAARAYFEGDLPPLQRLDFDMADSRGTLVNPSSLEKIWFPHFVRCLEPILETDVRMIWHCDGNLIAYASLWHAG
ncbi:MAG: hypothetical protein GY762_11165 [Proteobacteria bacterium]|nr:hypothetical protein [Pseudomonadota bacterium]